jgi:hypothetical protein
MNLALRGIYECLWRIPLKPVLTIVGSFLRDVEKVAVQGSQVDNMSHYECLLLLNSLLI